LGVRRSFSLRTERKERNTQTRFAHLAELQVGPMCWTIDPIVHGRVQAVLADRKVLRDQAVGIPAMRGPRCQRAAIGTCVIERTGVRQKACIVLRNLIKRRIRRDRLDPDLVSDLVQMCDMAHPQILKASWHGAAFFSLSRSAYSAKRNHITSNKHHGDQRCNSASYNRIHGSGSLGSLNRRASGPPTADMPDRFKPSGFGFALQNECESCASFCRFAMHMPLSCALIARRMTCW